MAKAAPSRAMDNLFWLGRYAERTESLVRILRAVAARLGEEPASALDLARKLLIPFSQATDTPALAVASDDEAGAGRGIAAPDLRPPPEPRPAAACCRGWKAPPGRCATGCRWTPGAPSMP